MGLGDYQLILYPAGNMPELTDMGMDFVGSHDEFTKFAKKTKMHF